MSRKHTRTMQVHAFTLVLGGVRELTDEVADALYEAGCDDATVGSRDGVVFLDYDREAISFREAVLSAIADVEKAGTGAQVVRVEPDDLVTMSDIAKRVGRTRESIRQLVTGLRGPGDFPPPVANVKQRSLIWRWTDVSRWFQENFPAEALPADEVGTAGRSRRGAAERPAPDAAAFIAAINAALDMRYHTRDAREAALLLEALNGAQLRRDNMAMDIVGGSTTQNPKYPSDKEIEAAILDLLDKRHPLAPADMKQRLGWPDAVRIGKVLTDMKRRGLIKPVIPVGRKNAEGYVRT